MKPETSDLLYRASHQAFLLGLALKAANAVLELIGGVMLLAVPAVTLRAWLAGALAGVQTWLPAGWPARLAGSFEAVTASTVTFVAWYFLSHGVLKALVIVCLWARKLWAYPLGIAVFVGFGAYQTWEYFRAGGVLYLALNVLDVLLITLTALEWRHALRANRTSVDTVSAQPPS